MNWEAISTIAESVGAIAVVASLIFVGWQLIQNTEAVKTSNAQSHVEVYFSITSHISGSRDVATVYNTGIYRPEELDEVDRVRFIGLLSGLFRYYETSYIQYRNGKLDREFWDTLEVQMSSIVSTPGFELWWSVREAWHSQEIRDLVKRMMADGSRILSYAGPTQRPPSNESPELDV